MSDTLRHIPAAPIPLNKGRLGRGLASLIGEPQRQADARLPAHGEQRLLPIAELHPSGLNPRKDFAPTELDELAELHPRQGPGSTYRLPPGQAAWRL